MRKTLLAASIAFGLAACGGGGDDTHVHMPAQEPATIQVPESQPAPEPRHPQQIIITIQQQQQQQQIVREEVRKDREKDHKDNKPPVLEGTLISAPANGDTVCLINVKVKTKGALNVEMVPDGSYTPRYGNFVYMAGSGGEWELTFNAAEYDGETISARVLAWDALPGEMGREITLMHTRQYMVQCEEPEPPATPVPEPEVPAEPELPPPTDVGIGVGQQQQQQQ